MASEKWRQVLNAYNESGLQRMFIETLGWLAPQKSTLKLSVGDDVVTVSVIAQLAGAAVVEVSEAGKPSPQWHRRVDGELKKHFSERLTRFSNPEGDSWYWPKKLASGALSYDRLETKHQKLPDFLAQRLAGLEFTEKDHSTPGRISPNEVRNRIRGQFESSKVTSDFFKKFKEKHELLKNEIRGLPTDQAASSYSTLILNRLMFVYFLQKKEFLNNDPNYLKNCLRQVQALKGKDKFYSFYRDYLLELFFNRLDRSDGRVKDPAIAKILGDVPYVNGGVFSQSESEKNFTITIPDDAFQEIFDFFDSYVWHLDTRPTGIANEINPEVIGYIFEQYINFTASGKKENGAYYTTHDVTGFMVRQSLIPLILDKFTRAGLPVLETVKSSPHDFVFESLRHGGVGDGNKWTNPPKDLQTSWDGDPSGWTLLDDYPTDPSICLPDETWVEMFHRRERVERLFALIHSGELTSVNDLVTHNLNTLHVINAVISEVVDPEVLQKLWIELSSMSILDPTCGSGAFLFAALEIMEDVYAKLADRIMDLDPESLIVKSLRLHPNRRYFIRKHVALHNLFGTDIMPDAIETTKLRIFLSLASCLESKSQIEPLPDLDFNLKVGNLVVGFKDASDVSRVERGKLLLDNELVTLGPDISDHVALYRRFQNASIANDERLNTLKVEVALSQSRLTRAADNYYAECAGMGPEEFKTWRDEVLPFHWSIEFPHVMSKGGFDVIIGNPPYIKKSEVPVATSRSLIGFSCQELPDFYAVCVERSQSLLNAQGRMSMIVMLSLSFGPGFERLRNLLIKPDKTAIWWSTFGKRPDSLFRGVQVRNTIFSSGPGEGAFGTKHNMFSSDSRKWLFDAVEHFDLILGDMKVPIRAGIASSIVDRLPVKVRPISEGSQVAYLRGTAQYWFPVMPFRPPVLGGSLKMLRESDNLVRSFRMDEREPVAMAVAVLAGKIGYLWWCATGDDLNVLSSQTLVPRRFIDELWGDPVAIELAQAVVEAGRDHCFASKNAGAMYINIRWTSARQVSDQFDRYVLAKLDLASSWRHLNVWYRQTMRSSGDNSNSSKLSRGQFDILMKARAGAAS